MNNNQNTQPIKPDPKGKAVASLILGIISTALVVITLVSIYGIMPLPKFFGPIAFIVMYNFAVIPIAMIGWILGMKSLKSTKSNLAITGIILSIVGLLTSIYI